jgi:O-antigen ligase
MTWLPIVLSLAYGFGLAGSFSLGKLLAVSLSGLWLCLGRVYWKDSKALLAYLLAVVVSALFSIDPWLSFWGLQGTYNTGVLCALVLVPFWVCLDSRHSDDLENGLRLAAVGVSVIGLAQLFGFFLPQPLPLGHRVYSSIGSPIYLGAFLVMCFPFLGSRIEYGLVLACLVATGSRGALLALGLGMGYRYRNKFIARQIIWGFVGLAGAATLALVLRPPSDIGRILVWSAAWEAFKAKPIFGFGTGTYLLIAERFRNPAWDDVYGVTTQDHAHNLFLEALSTGGIATLLALCSTLYALWSKATDKTKSALLGVFVIGLLNPLPLVVKALCIALVAVNVHGEQQREFPKVAVLGVILFFLVCWLVHLDRMMGIHGQYPWSLSSVKAAILSNAVRVGPDGRL